MKRWQSKSREKGVLYMGKQSWHVANCLRELRREHELTQEKLAEDLGVTRHTILALEVGRYVPSIELALRLAAHFQRPLETIFWLEENQENEM